MRRKEAYEALLDEVKRLSIIDTHEHLPPEAERPKGADVLSEWLTHCISEDLVSAGLSDEELALARDPSGDLLGRWKLIEPYWQAVQSTGYGRAMSLSARDLYGVEEIGRGTIERLNEAFCAAREKGGHYRYVLKEKSGITVALLALNREPEREFFVPVYNVDELVNPAHRKDAVELSRRAGVKIHSLGDWKGAARIILDRWFDERGAVSLKSAMAYQGPLLYEKATDAEAERDFSELFEAKNSPDWRRGVKMRRAFVNHMMHFILAWADEREAPVQFHTGFQAGGGNVIPDANPALLSNLFIEYGSVRFNLLHMGYPYTGEVSVLAKNFRNVFIDMSWGPMVSPEASRRALVEWLDAVPANKICAFGGDFCFVDGVYGHQVLAREVVASALATKVADGSFGLERAVELARWMLFDNPVGTYRLEVPGQQ